MQSGEQSVTVPFAVQRCWKTRTVETSGRFPAENSYALLNVMNRLEIGRRFGDTLDAFSWSEIFSRAWSAFGWKHFLPVQSHSKIEWLFTIDPQLVSDNEYACDGNLRTPLLSAPVKYKDLNFYQMIPRNIDHRMSICSFLSTISCRTRLAYVFRSIHSSERRCQATVTIMNCLNLFFHAIRFNHAA